MSLVNLSRLGLVAALALTLFFGLHPGGPHSVGGLFPWDKADHFSAFFTLAVLAMAAFPKQPLWRIGVALAILGALIEFIQALPFEHRDCDFWDWVAEMCALAAVYGTVIAARIRRDAA